MKILVDSSVWIDLFDDRVTIQTAALVPLVARGERLLAGDLIMAEVLQGTRDRSDFARKLAQLDEFEGLPIVDRRVAVEAARNYQRLRALGITIRKTIDTLIATRCILDGLPLLYSDRDFDPFVEHLGLRSALDYGVK